MVLNPMNLGYELEYLFKKYYILNQVPIDFHNFELNQEALDTFNYDYNRYFKDSNIIIEKLYTRLELVGILLYRISRAYFLNHDETAAQHFSNLGRIISGMEIFYTAEIGEGIKINHG